MLPLAISTAAAALYQKSHLGLPYPSKDSKPRNKTILIWGGSSSVGASAIQLARASGLTVFTTASSHNHPLVKTLGATRAFDYNQGGVVDEIAAALKGCDFVGIFDAVCSKESYTTNGGLLSKLGGGTLSCSGPPMNVPLPDNVKPTNGTTRCSSSDALADFGLVYAVDISTKEVEVGDAIWQKYVPEALKSGHLQAKPDPIVIKGGLAKMQEALDRQRQGVSAGKVVVSS